MDDIMNQVERVTELISEIGSATHEQTLGIGQVSGQSASWIKSLNRMRRWWKNLLLLLKA